MSIYGSVQDLITLFEEPSSPDDNPEIQSDYNENVALRSNSVSWYDRYATKKTLSNTMLNGAVLSTNATQLRTLLTPGFFDIQDPKWFISMCLVCSSILLQVIILVLSGVLVNTNILNKKRGNFLNIVNNLVLILTGLLFGINICVNVFVQIDFTLIINKNRSNPHSSVFSFGPTNVPTLPMDIPESYWSSSSTMPPSTTTSLPALTTN